MNSAAYCSSAPVVWQHRWSVYSVWYVVTFNQYLYLHTIILKWKFLNEQYEDIHITVASDNEAQAAELVASVLGRQALGPYDLGQGVRSSLAISGRAAVHRY